jgi:hypothetical protein
MNEEVAETDIKENTGGVKKARGIVAKKPTAPTQLIEW